MSKISDVSSYSFSLVYKEKVKLHYWKRQATKELKHACLEITDSRLWKFISNIYNEPIVNSGTFKVLFAYLKKGKKMP